LIKADRGKPKAATAGAIGPAVFAISRRPNPMKTILGLIILAVGVFIGCSASPSSRQISNTNSEPTPLATSTVAASTVQEKQPCPLKISEAPVIKGLKLGMTPDDVLKLFPGSKDDPQVRSQLSQPPKFGATSLTIRPEKYESKADFSEISLVSVSTLDGRVSSVALHYRGPHWSHVDQFVAKFVEGTNLPGAEQWEAFVGQDTQLKTLTCAEFSIRLYAGAEGGSQNYILEQDLAAARTLKERKRKAQEEASPTPNP
jgi:hypothetical protein